MNPTLVTQLMLSVLVAMTVGAVALASGWGFLGALVIYTLSGSLTLLLLSAWGLVREDIRI